MAEQLIETMVLTALWQQFSAAIGRGVIIAGDEPIRRLNSSPVFQHKTLARA
jgi:hypothetical protein